MTIEIVDYTPEAREPKYSEDVKAVHASGKYGAVVIPADELTTVKRHIQEAARFHGLTARVAAVEELDDATVRIVFSVKERKVPVSDVAAE